MLKTIKEVFARCLAPETNAAESQPLEQRLQLATAALMIEMMHADYNVSEQEESAIIAALKTAYHLSDSDLDDIIQLAHEEKREATSLYGFTSLINEHYSQQQKLEVIRLLWEIAYADQHFDKHELHLMRKISDLLYVPREIAMGIRDSIKNANKVK